MRIKKSYKFTAASTEIQHLCKSDKKLSKLIHSYGDLEYELHTDPFAHLINTIVGQLLSNRVADVLQARLEHLCGGKITVAKLSTLTSSEIRNVGISNAKTDYIKGLVNLATHSPDFFTPLTTLSDKDIIERLTSIRGIGPWSAKMHLIFVLNRMDVIPYEDGAFLQSYKWLYNTTNVSKKSIENKCKKWHPYASIAARYLYRALDSGLVNN